MSFITSLKDFSVRYPEESCTVTISESVQDMDMFPARCRLLIGSDMDDVQCTRLFERGARTACFGVGGFALVIPLRLAPLPVSKFS